MDLMKEKLEAVDASVTKWCELCSHRRVCHHVFNAFATLRPIVSCNYRHIPELIPCDSELCRYCVHDEHNTETGSNDLTCAQCDKYTLSNFTGVEAYKS